MLQHFCIYLEDYALPGFCSGEKEYFGTKNDLIGFYENIKQIPNYGQEYLDSFKAFLDGQMSATHIVAYNEHVVGKRVRCYGKKEFTIDEPFYWTHKNIWDCPYDMYFSKCKNEHIWVQVKNNYYRCIKSEFYDLAFFDKYSSPKYHPITDRWGQPGYFIIEKNMFKALLYVKEKSFASKDELLQDMENFTANHANYTEVMNEIFADG